MCGTSTSVPKSAGSRRASVRRWVISIDQFNRIRNDLCIVAPITGTDRGLEYHVRVAPPEGGLTKPSIIMCEQEKSQSIDRFLSRRGVVSNQTLSRVQQIVGALIDR